MSIELAGEPVFNGICHCANCKARTGSAFGWSVYFPNDRLLATHGAPRVYAFQSASGPQARRFCGDCGTTLFWDSAAFPGVVGVAGGCFAAPGPGEPTLSASESGRCPWLALPEPWRRAP